ncbi:SRPBCC family protein [Nocardia crassostreae]|uniref:SRPBCC family protein n=1 Tax=Nocardia crassostreae TaxID=53428 RepID=UPI0008327307|nr:SRPBCC family protein [Nocardia crassostreae]
MRTKNDHRFVIDIDPDQVMEALLLVEQLPDWSPSHQDVRVATRDKLGRPKRVYVSANIMGRPDRQVVEYTCTESKVAWKVTESSAGAGGQGFFELAELKDGSTEVWYHTEVYLPIPAPGMLLKRGARREGEATIANFVAFVEALTGVEGLADGPADLEEMPYADSVGYEPATNNPWLHHGGKFEPGFGTA